MRRIDRHPVAHDTPQPCDLLPLRRRRRHQRERDDRRPLQRRVLPPRSRRLRDRHVLRPLRLRHTSERSPATRPRPLSEELDSPGQDSHRSAYDDPQRRPSRGDPSDIHTRVPPPSPSGHESPNRSPERTRLENEPDLRHGGDGNEAGGEELCGHATAHRGPQRTSASVTAPDSTRAATSRHVRKASIAATEPAPSRTSDPRCARGLRAPPDPFADPFARRTGRAAASADGTTLCGGRPVPDHPPPPVASSRCVRVVGNGPGQAAIGRAAARPEWGRKGDRVRRCPEQER